MAFGYKVYFSNRAEDQVMAWNPDTGKSQIIAGKGSETPETKISDPYGLCMDPKGRLLIADKFHHRILRVDQGKCEKLETKDIDGHRKRRAINHRHDPITPTGLFAEKKGSILACFCDENTVYRIHEDGRLELLLGISPSRHYVVDHFTESATGKDVQNTPVCKPTHIVETKDGTIFVIERAHHVIRRYNVQDGLSCLFP